MVKGAKHLLSSMEIWVWSQYPCKEARESNRAQLYAQEEKGGDKDNQILRACCPASLPQLIPCSASDLVPKYKLEMIEENHHGAGFWLSNVYTCTSQTKACTHTYSICIHNMDLWRRTIHRYHFHRCPSITQMVSCNVLTGSILLSLWKPSSLIAWIYRWWSKESPR